jgi:tol-pal system protein YbgF
MRPLSRAFLPALALCLTAASAWADPQAFDADLRARLNAAAAQERALEGRISDDNARLGNVQVAQLFGESDADKAAREQHEQNQDSGIASLSQRVGDMENSLRSLTGQVEQLDHRISVMNDRIERMQKDFDYKLCNMAAQQLGVSPGDANALPCTGTQAGAAPAPMTNPAPQNFAASSGAASGPPAHLAPPPGVLGTIPSNTPMPLPPAGQADAGPAPVPHPEFDAAMKLLAKAQFDQARAGFRSFVDGHAADPLAAQALYWIGDIDYVQKDYATASRDFAEGIKKYPTSARAPDSMLKLGQSLIAMNQKKEGCTVLGALPTKYPDAPKPIAARAANDRKALCK